MFIVSGPKLVVESCKQGLVGTFPALNARNDDILDQWLQEIGTELSKRSPSSPPYGPYGVNLIVHRTNPRLQENLKRIVKHKVPLVITSLGAVKDVIDAVHSYGGLVFHDVTNLLHARKAAAAGVDGIIAVCSGAGGHAGAISPFALIPKIREFWDGTLLLSGAIGDGAGVRAAQVLGADLAYLGTRFIATQESAASEGYKKMLTESKEGPAPFFLPTVYTDKVSGVYANFLRKSLENAGLNPDNPKGEGLGEEDFSKLSDGSESKAWKDIWSAGHGVLNINDVPTTAELVARLKSEYQGAVQRERSLSSKL